MHFITWLPGTSVIPSDLAVAIMGITDVRASANKGNFQAIKVLHLSLMARDLSDGVFGKNSRQSILLHDLRWYHDTQWRNQGWNSYLCPCTVIFRRVPCSSSAIKEFMLLLPTTPLATNTKFEPEIPPQWLFHHLSAHEFVFPNGGWAAGVTLWNNEMRESDYFWYSCDDSCWLKKMLNWSRYMMY